MKYCNIHRAIFKSRPNRFIAHVELDGTEVVCHVKNTGRCKELLVPGATVYIEKAENPRRKTPYDLIAVEKGSRLINMDAQAPNRVFLEWAREHWPELLTIRSEVTYGASRIDFCIETAKGKTYVEVKGVTLEEDGRVYFPDAPTERGVKHLHELTEIIKAGHGAAVCFVIQMEEVTSFSPNDRTHKAFGDALREAKKKGVTLLAYSCRVTPDSLMMDKAVDILL